MVPSTSSQDDAAADDPLRLEELKARTTAVLVWTRSDENGMQFAIV